MWLARARRAPPTVLATWLVCNTASIFQDTIPCGSQALQPRQPCARDQMHTIRRDHMLLLPPAIRAATGQRAHFATRARKNLRTRARARTRAPLALEH